MLFPIFLVILVLKTEGSKDAEGCKEILQGFLSGQLSSALGMYHVRALRREFKSLKESLQNTLKEVETKNKRYIDKSVSKIRRTLIEKDNTNSWNGSTVYIRWGKKACAQNAELVYSGYMGGSYYTHTGAAVEPLCLPTDPQWGYYKEGFDGYKQFIYGAEFRTYNFRKSLNLHDPPCAVCRIYGRTSVYMLPARKTCHKGWNLEYSGYLMSGYHRAASASKFTCVDEDPDFVTGGNAEGRGYLLYNVEASCGSLKCPPYVGGRELTCAVCSAP